MIEDLFSSVAVSALGAILTYGITRLWPIVRALRLRRLSTIEGIFITDLEEKPGVPAMRQALTQIHQQGLKVRGVTTCLRSRRFWHLEGEIDRSGFLRGIFRDGETSEELGSFLLAIERSGDSLSGLWSACHEMQRKVLTASYSLRRCEASEAVGLLGRHNVP